MSDYLPSQEVRDALRVFLNAVRQEPGAPAGTTDEAIDEDHRKAIAVLRACAGPAPARTLPAVVPARQEPASKLVKPYAFPKLDLEAEAPGAITAAPDPGPAPELAPEKDMPSASTPKPDIEPATPQPTRSLVAERRSVMLRNARAGEAYADMLRIDGAQDLTLVDAGRSGLSFDAADGTFSGTPAEAGDFELRLKGRIGDRPVEIVAHLAVIADPKSLWTSLPSERDAPFWKPDEAFVSVDGPALSMIGASKRGRSHAKTGGFREDDMALVVHGAWHVAAVADGAGSARFSRRGSQLAVEAVRNRLPALLDANLGDDLEPLLAQMDDRTELEGELRRRLYNSLVTAAFEAVAAIEQQAEALNEPVAAFSTTLIVTVARKLATSWFVAAFSVGDGGAALLDQARGAVTPLTVPDSGEYAGQTRFLTRGEFADYDAVVGRLRYATPERFTAIVLMSDGITDPKLPTDKAFADPETWRGFWSDDLTAHVDFAKETATVERAFLAWLDFWSPGNHDDRTIAVLLPREP